MGNIREQLGYIGVSDAFGLLKSGLPLYIASAPLSTQALPLRGAWVDDSGNLHYDCASVYLSKYTALQVAREHNQICILALSPNLKGAGRAYILRDTPRARAIALRYCGGYTADGKFLLTATNRELPLSVLGEVDTIPVDIAFPEVQ